MKHTTITGMGFLKDNEGVITSKFHCPPGKEFELTVGYTAEDVENIEALNLIDVPDPVLSDEQQKQKLIRDEMVSLAVEELKKKNKLDDNGNLVK